MRPRSADNLTFWPKLVKNCSDFGPKRTFSRICKFKFDFHNATSAILGPKEMNLLMVDFHSATSALLRPNEMYLLMVYS